MPDFGRWGGNGGDPSLNEINRTDQLLDALANQQPVYATDPGEAELAQLLAGWRDEVRTPPLMAPVTPRDATHALRRAVEARKRTRTSMAVVGSVAAAVLCLGGFGAVVAGAGPGDALYGLHTMLFGEQEKTRTDQVALASQQLAEVQQLIDEGQWDAAQDKLQTLTTTVATVNDVEQKQELVSQWQQLTVKVDAKDANASLPPGAPPPPMPEPAVVAPGSDTSTSSSTSTSSGTATSPSSDTATSSSETSTSTSSGTSSPTSSSPVPEQPPSSGTSTTTTPPTSTTTTTTTTTTTHAVTTTTTTSQAAPPAGASAQVVAPTSVAESAPAVVAPPTVAASAPVAPAPAVVAPPSLAAPPAAPAPAPAVTPEAPRHRAPETPVTESQAPVTIPVTTTLTEPPPKPHGGGG
ncbi:anti-sigma-D factor RsdA [Mycolicibacterium moriokaense]|uniref:Anti-sigma-D factor RsdA-like protein n=1 Tax=Mycolicibacterium moriokaense TaxID=39691 RepID=A0A318HIC2_9MYCO|nr:anti-sigma-D factor RsdA [Mycolicibacterium moriokaense]PXX05304.1 anti-sigma-D factor RsdA-like protein [Mycolicibacterium moriokaense]